MKGLREPLLGKQETTLKALGQLALFAGPSVLSLFFQMSVEFINIFFIGNIDKYMLDGVGLGNMWGNITGIAIGWGLAGGLDTLCSQANGSGQLHMVGVWLQRALCILSFFFIGIAFAWIKTQDFLLSIGVTQVISEHAFVYLSHVLPGLWFFLAFDFYRRFLQSQGYFWPAVIVNFCTTTLHVFWNWLLVIYCGYNVEGAGIATSITYFSNFALIVVIIRVFSLDKKTCVGCDWSNFWPEVLKYLEYGIPAAGMVVLDYLNFEITQLEANLLGAEVQAAHVSVLNTTSLLYMVPLGTSIAISVIVGNLVGNEEQARAKLYSFASFLMIVIVMIPINLVLCLMRANWAELYSYDRQVIDLISQLIIPMCVFNIIDSIQTILGGVLKGLARQTSASIVIFISYYVLSLPVGYMLAFWWELNILGIWYGMILGATSASLTLGWLVYTSTWEAETLS